MTLPDFLRRDDLGEIFLTGHRITLYHVLKHYKQGHSPEMLVDQFPTLPLALAHKVIAFYLENREDVDRYLEETCQEIDRQAAAPQQGPSFEELKRRLATRRQAESA